MILTWILITITVVLGSMGDVLCAKGMSSGEPVSGFHPSGFARMVRAIVTHRLVILGIACDAVSFFSLLGLLSVAQLSIAVPATALSFVVDTIGAKFFLHEHVHLERWLGVLFVAAGVLLTMKTDTKTPLTGPRPAVVTAVQAHKH